MNNEKMIEEAKELQLDLLSSIEWSGIGGVKCGSTAINLYKKGWRKQREWISVDERLPEKEQIVLCYLGLAMNVYTYKGDNTWEDSYGYWQKDEPITHWMPLPEPPKIKGE